jgi:hypothetical protein
MRSGHLEAVIPLVKSGLTLSSARPSPQRRSDFPSRRLKRLQFTSDPAVDAVNFCQHGINLQQAIPHSCPNKRMLAFSFGATLHRLSPLSRFEP